jgi:hypothetical protein
MPSQATTADAQLILQLYDFRREVEMRKARSWWASTFNPQSADDIIALVRTPGQENAYFRQVLGYWEMAAALVTHGALNEDLFFATGGEMWFTLGKIQPFLQDYRDKVQSPDTLQIVEKLATNSDAGRERLQRMVKMHEARRKPAKS